MLSLRPFGERASVHVLSLVVMFNDSNPPLVEEKVHVSNGAGVGSMGGTLICSTSHSSYNPE